MRRCPTYEPPKWQKLQTFYLGLQASTKAMIDAAAGGTINKKSVDEAYELIDTMASNDYSERSAPKNVAEIFQVDNNTAMAAQMSLMQQQLIQIVSAINALTKICESCGGAHSSRECQVGSPFAQPEQVNYTNNYQRGPGNSYGQYNNNQYNPNWRNHPNLSWGNTSNTLQPQQNFNAPEKKMSTEDMFGQLMMELKKGNERTAENELQIKNQNAAIKNLEMQLGQLHYAISQRPQGAFPSDTEKNPRE